MTLAIAHEYVSRYTSSKVCREGGREGDREEGGREKGGRDGEGMRERRTKGEHTTPLLYGKATILTLAIAHEYVSRYTSRIVCN